MRFLDHSATLAGDRSHDAIEMLRAVTRESPDLPSAWVRLAESLEASGAIPQAGEAWRMAHRLVPNSPRISTELHRLEADDSARVARPGEPTEEPTESRRRALVDIDRLISDLQSGRSRMEIDLRRLDTDIEQVSQIEDEQIATETLARIFAAQNLFADAVRIYELLADREEDAGKAEILRARAEDLRKRVSQ